MRKFVFYDTVSGNIISTLRRNGDPDFPDGSVFIEVPDDVETFAKKVNIETLEIDDVEPTE